MDSSLFDTNSQGVSKSRRQIYALQELEGNFYDYLPTVRLNEDSRQTNTRAQTVSFQDRSSQGPRSKLLIDELGSSERT